MDWPPTVGTQYRCAGRLLVVASVREGIDEAHLTPDPSEGRTSQGIKVLKEEWAEFDSLNEEVA